MEGRFCPLCRSSLQIAVNETFKYDPVLSVEEILYKCPVCGHEEKVEYLR